MGFSFSDLLEIGYVGAAQWADPVGGEVFEGGAGIDAVARISLGGVVNVITDDATVLVHGLSSWVMIGMADVARSPIATLSIV
jgi:hypothetical protein